MSIVYKKVCLSAYEKGYNEILVALLSEIGFESFEEEQHCLYGYIQNDQFSEENLKETLHNIKVEYSVEEIQPQNWNETWERDFTPVIIDDFCAIIADFHKDSFDTEYKIRITPKMSFGTGHHATTQLMIKAMRNISFGKKEVFDFGMGTGVLAILAELLGAEKIIGVDNEEWACENAIENAEKNNCSKVDFKLGSAELVENNKFDIILANINRHILLKYMNLLSGLLKSGAVILMSGILIEDRGLIISEAENVGLSLVYQGSLDKWLLLQFIR